MFIRGTVSHSFGERVEEEKQTDKETRCCEDQHKAESVLERIAETLNAAFDIHHHRVVSEGDSDELSARDEQAYGP
jgi:hypothetical protein